jgi:Rieske Fe-S protein
MGVTDDDTVTTTRRAMLAGAGAAGVAVTLAACGSDNGGGGSTPTQGAATPTTGAPATTGSTGGGGGGGGGIKTADIPVSGGKIFKDTDTVITQPAAGTFKAFSATCTHQGCPVGSVSANLIHCPCHNSAYNATDGSVKNGPATQPLAPKTVTVSGDTITVS